MKSLIKNLYYNNPTLYPVIKSGVDLYYRLETALVNDEAYYKKRFRQVFGYEPNLLNPRSFSEKLTWLKLHQRSPIITQCADKYAVRAYVREKLSSDDILIPLVFHTTNPKDINPEKLPDYPVIVKANHYSSEVHIIREREREREIYNKIQFDCKRWLNHNFYYRERERQYKHIPRKILVEKLITDSQGKLPADYKFHCFHGKTVFIQLDVDRETGHKRNLYDADFNYLDIGFKFPRGENIYAKPPNFETMKQIAHRLSEDFPYVRVDLYNVDGKIYFGELTFTPEAGLGKFSDPEFDMMLGEKLTLPV